MHALAAKPYLFATVAIFGALAAQLAGCSADGGDAEGLGTAGAGAPASGVTSGGDVTTGAPAASTTGATSGNSIGATNAGATTADAAVSGAVTGSTTSAGAVTTGEGNAANTTTGAGMTSNTSGTGGTTGAAATTTGSDVTTGVVTTGSATTGDATTGSVTTNSVTTGSATTGSATTGSATTGGTPVDTSELVGWATVSDCGPNGTVGGGAAAPITVTDTASLKAAMNSSEPQVIYVSGSIQTPGNISGRHNKTLIGINNAEIYGGWGLVGCTNIIVQNIKFRDGPNDSFGLSGSACIWIDHCEFVDGTDGNFDIVNGTDFVTISWSHFYYTVGHDHMFANLVGNTQPHEGDVGREKITYHHNWWGAGITSRKPRVRYGQVHLFNNYYGYTAVAGDAGDDYDIGAGFESRLLVESNYFDGSSEPITWMDDDGTAQVVERNNHFVNAGGVVTRGSAFTPPYEYQHVMESAEQVKASVMAGAGVQ